MSTFKKLFASVASAMVVASTLPVSVFGQTSYSAELQDAYDYAKGVGLTTQSTIDGARMYDNITRAEFAKVAATFATEVLGKTPDTSASCSFTDLASIAGSDLVAHVTAACQLGLMGVGTNGVFNPNGSLTRAEFGTVLSRLLYGDANNGGNPWYANHLQALKDAGVLNNISNPMALEVRGYVFIALQRADEGGSSTPAICQDPMTQLSCALGLDDCPAECSGDETDEDEEDEVVFEGVGTLDVDLSSDTPESATLPGAVAGVTVASFDFSASDDADVRVDSVKLKRYGVSSSTDTLAGLALSHESGRLTNSKDESSNGEVTLSIKGGLVVKAGETETINVIVEVGDESVAGGDEFNIGVLEVSSTAEDVNVTSDRSEMMEVATQNGPELELSEGSSVPDVKVGQENVAVAKFDLQNNDSEKEIMLEGIVFEQIGSADTEDAVEEFSLLIDGDEVATADSANDDYVTFYLDNAFVLEDGDEVQLELRANVIGEQGEDLAFQVKDKLDVMASSEDGFGAVITGEGTASDSAAVDIEAGEVVVSAVDPTFDELRYDRDNVILGELVINVNQGDGLELNTIEFDMDHTGLGFQADDELFENVELVNKTNGGSVDLDIDGDTNTTTFGDDDLGIILNAGKNTFQVRADIKDLDNSEASAFNGQSFELSLNNIGTTGLEILDDEDDAITDITPSALTWASWDGTDSAVDYTAVNMSSSLTVVKGATDVVALTFDVESNGAGAVTVQEFTVTGDSANFANTHITEVKLYKDSVDSANLLKSRAGSQISSQSITFSSFNGGDIEVEQDETQRFIVTVSFVNTTAIDGDSINLGLSNARVRDDQNNLLTFNGNLMSPRTITVSSGGSFDITVDAANTATNYAKYILGDVSESDPVLALKVVATNEAYKIEDLTLQFSGAVPTVVDAVKLFNGATQVASKSVSVGSTSVTFNNLNYTVPAGTTTLLVKLDTSKLGYEQNATDGVNGLALGTPSVNVRGVSSNQTATDSAASTGSLFGVVPVKLSSMSFVSTFGGEVVDSSLSEGSNTVAILKVTAAETTNLWAANSTNAKLQIAGLAATILTGGVDVTDLEIERIGGANAALTDDGAGDGLFTNISDTDFQVAGGETAYFVIRATASGVDANDSVQIRFSSLGSAGLSFSTDEPGSVFDGVRIQNLSTLTAPKVTASN